MEVVLDDNGIWEYTKIDIPKLAALDAQSLAQWKKDVARAKRIILEGFSDPGGCRSPPTYSTWTPTTVSFNFLVSLIIAHFPNTFFTRSYELCPKTYFSARTEQGTTS